MTSADVNGRENHEVAAWVRSSWEREESEVEEENPERTYLGSGRNGRFLGGCGQEGGMVL